MPHICADEIFAFMAMFPFIGYFFAKLHTWWHVRFNHKCHHKVECQEHHLEHPEELPMKCTSISHPNIQGGWGCCQCRTFNGDQRTECKHCQHSRCDQPVEKKKDISNLN